MAHRPDGITEDEVRWYSEQRQADIRVALRYYTRRATLWFVLLSVAAITNGVFTSQFAASGRDAIVKSGRVVAVAGCNRDYQDREKFRALLQRLKKATRANPATTPEQKRTALDFYNDQLKAYPSIDCRPSAMIITDDPGRLPRAPEPCWKGNPNNPTECKAPSPSQDRP